jgi:hypothetical protein
MELGVLAQYRAGKRRDQRLYGVTEDEITGNKAADCLNCSLAIECSEKCIAQFAAVSR